MTHMRVEMYLPDEGRLELPAIDAMCSLAQLGGGCTVIYGTGEYHMMQGRAATDPVRIVTVFCEDTPDERLRLESIARAYLEDTQEDAVLYVININEVNLIGEY